VLVGLFITALASIAAAEDQQAATSKAFSATREAPSLFPQDAPRNPYAKLFVASAPAAQERPSVQAHETGRVERPRVVCGMVVIPVDAGIDPQMRKSPPAAENTTHTIRAVKPPMCTSQEP